MVTEATDILKELAEKQPRIQRIDDRWGGRYYQVEGIEPKLPSVTTVLNVISKPALVPWAKNMALENVRKALTAHDPRGEDVLLGVDYSEWVDGIIAEAKALPDKARDEAADFGTRLHALIDERLKSIEAVPVVAPDLVTPFYAFKDWYRDSGLTIHQSEFMVYSETWGYAGTVDAIATRQTPTGEELVVVDWKTSNAIYREMFAQISAYALALEEMIGKPISEGWVLRLGKKKPEFEAKRLSREDLTAGGEAFRNALGLSQWMKGK